jgi:hypothetical protein
MRGSPAAIARIDAVPPSDLPAAPTAQWGRNLSPPEVSSETGISAFAAGDFWEILAKLPFFESLETSEMCANIPQNAGIRAKIDHNLRSSDWLAGVAGIEPPDAEYRNQSPERGLQLTVATRRRFLKRKKAAQKGDLSYFPSF